MIPDNEIINAQLIKASNDMAIATICKAFGIARSVFHYRKNRYERYGLLQSRSKRHKHTRATPQELIGKITDMYRAHGWKASRISREL